MIKWLQTLFSRGQSSHTPHSLDPHLLEILDALDQKLNELSDGHSGAVMPHLIPISIYNQSGATDDIVKKAVKLLPAHFNYIPRGIAVVIDNDGTWNLLIGLRGNVLAPAAMQVLFTDALARTNDSRA